MTAELLGRRAFLKWLAVSGTGVAAGGLLGACGSREGGAPKPAPGTTTAAAPATAASVPTAAPTATPRLATPAGKKEVVVAQGADITTLDPHLSTIGNDLTATFNIFDNLTFRDADLTRLQPMLATDWRTTSDTEWTFKLRPGVKWHNGDPFSSADVKFSIERTYDATAKTIVATIFTTVDHVEVPNDLTVVFTTKKPDPLLPNRLAHYGGQIIPRRYFEQVGKDGFAAKPIGTGPYTYVEWVKDDHLALAANKDYWGGPPAVERLVVKPRPETAARVASLLGGEADIVVNVPPDQLDQVNKSGKAHVESALFNGLYVLAVNSKVPPLDNQLVKQALSLAIDRETIIKTIWRSQAILPNGGISKGDFAYDPNLPPLEYDPNKAKALLRQANYNNEEIVIESTQGYMNNDRQMGEAIGQMWKSVSVNVRVELVEISVRAQKNRDRSFRGLWWSDPGSTVLDPDGMMWRLLGPGGPQDYWRDSEFDRLGEEARFSLDPDLRRKNYARMNEILRENLPWIPILQPMQLFGVQNFVQFTPYGTGYLNFRRENLKLAP